MLAQLMNLSDRVRFKTRFYKLKFSCLLALSFIFLEGAWANLEQWCIVLFIQQLMFAFERRELWCFHQPLFNKGSVWSSLVAQTVKICRQCRRPGFDPWVGKIPSRNEWQATLVFLPAELQAKRSLAGYSPWGCIELDTIECYNFYFSKDMSTFCLAYNSYPPILKILRCKWHIALN